MARYLDGWIKLHRRILAEHAWVGHDGVALAVFVTLLLMANVEDGESYLVQGETVRRGQVVTSDRELAKRLKFARTTVQTKLNKMAQDKMLGLQPGRWRGVITILNYDKYQCHEEDVGPLVGPESGHDRAHNKEGVGFKENFSPLSPVSAFDAGARVDPPWRTPAGAQVEARRILAKALGAPGRAGEHASEEELWEEVGWLGRAVILTRSKTFALFWGAYWAARRHASQTMVDGQMREEFAAILTDPEFEAAAEVERGTRAIIGESGAAGEETC